MASTPESRVKSKAVEIIKRYDAWYFFPAQNGYGRAGIPDCIICYRGLFLAVEFKAGGGKTTPLQDKELAAIENAGGATFVINEYNLQVLDFWFDRIY